MASSPSADGSERLPMPCPHCESELETRDDVLVHVFLHWGDDDA